MDGKRRTNAGLAADDLERILEVTRHLASSRSLDTLLAEVIEAGKAVLDAERGSVFLHDAAAHELVARVATGLDEIRIPDSLGIVGECARTRALINVPDCYADPRFNRDVDRKTGYRTRCLLALPLVGHDDTLVGVLQILNKKEGVFDHGEERIATALAAQCAVALQRARLTEELVHKERLERELAVARDIQMGILPKVMPHLPGYDVHGLTRAAEETGGDAFDIVPLGPEGLLLLLADATGHGVGPALSVTQVRSMLRIAVRLGAGLDEILGHTNDQLAQDLADNRFVTAFIGRLDAADHLVTYHAAGQGPLMHFHAATGKFDWHGATTLPLGCIGGIRIKPPASMALEPGDIVGLLTDGVYETEDPGGDAFGKNRVEDLVRRHANGSMEDLAAALLAAVDSFCQGTPQADDITILLAARRQR